MFNLRYQNTIYEDNHHAEQQLQQAIDQIYTVPEFIERADDRTSLRPTRSVRDVGSSKPGDVYAFSILLVEISSRADFFQVAVDDDLSARPP